MRYTRKIFLIAVVFVSCITSCVSLRCYQCMSNREGKCDNESQMEIKECEISADATNSLHVQPVCIKIIKDIRGIEQFITRSCGFEGSLLHPCDAHQTAEHCSTCMGNLCNKSNQIILNYSIIFIPLIGYLTRLYSY